MRAISALLVAVTAGQLCLAEPATSVAGGRDERIELAKRYVDPLYGFALRPPDRTERHRHASGGQLVSWLRRNTKTGEILWTLSLGQATEDGEIADLRQYSEELAKQLQMEGSFKIESVEIKPVGGKPAIRFRGGGAMGLWRRQTWILAQPGQFITIDLAGRSATTGTLDDLYERVLATVELFDPSESRRIRAENLRRGSELLASLNGEKLARVIDTEGQWFLLSAGGKSVGYRRVLSSPARRKGAAGFEVVVWVDLNDPKLGRRLLKHKMFASSDMSVTWSRKALQIAPGPRAAGARARMVKTEWLKQDNQLVCTVSADGQQPRPHSITVPVDGFLPRAVGMLLGRLIDLKTPASLALLVYNDEEQMLNLRTVTVVGPDSVEVAGRTVRATRVLDQPARDAEPATCWLDEGGRLLRMEGPDGFVMVRAGRAEVLAKFPAAEGTLKMMGD